MIPPRTWSLLLYKEKLDVSWPEGRQSHQMCAMSGKLYVFGGRSRNGGCMHVFVRRMHELSSGWWLRVLVRRMHWLGVWINATAVPWHVRLRLTV